MACSYLPHRPRACLKKVQALRLLFVTQDTEEAGEGEEALLWRKMITDLLQESPQALKLGQSVRHSYLQYRVHPSSPRTEWKCPSLLISDEHLNRTAFSRTDSLIIFLK